MIRKVYGILAGLAVAGATLFQGNGCTANLTVTGLEDLLGGVDFGQVDEGEGEFPPDFEGEIPGDDLGGLDLPGWF